MATNYGFDEAILGQMDKKGTGMLVLYFLNDMV